MSFVFLVQELQCKLRSLQLRSRQAFGVRGILILLFMSVSLALSTSCRQEVKPTKKVSADFESRKTSKNGEKKKSDIQTDTQEKTVKITLYFADSKAEYLIPETREVPVGQSMEEVAVKELIKGPQNPQLAACLPRETKLREIRLRGEVAYADFSEELVREFPGGSAAETMAIYAVVNTLAEFPQVKKVKFLVEGKPISSLSGHYDMSQAFEPRKDLIKENSE